MKLAFCAVAAAALFVATPAVAEQVLYCFPNGQAMLFSGTEATGYSLNAAGACAGGPWVTVLELTAPVVGTPGPRRDRDALRAFAVLSRLPTSSETVLSASPEQIAQMRSVKARSTLKMSAGELQPHVARLLATDPPRRRD